MRHLPPLNSLRAFEVAARTGSFVQAGSELGVTAAAVSQQVKQLEGHLGKKLFARQGNRIILTDAGRTIYPRLEQAFSDIAALTAFVVEGEQRAQLVVSVLPSLAQLWLLPRLAGFDGRAGLEIRVEEDPVTFSRQGVDLRITYGAAYYADHRVEVLFKDRIVPLCSAAFADELVDGIAGLPDEAFIHTSWGEMFASEPSWSTWMAQARFNRFPDPAHGLRVDLSSLAIAAAREGLGIALAPQHMAQADLSAGRLIIADSISLAMPSDYVLVYPNALSRRASLRALVAHLLKE